MGAEVNSGPKARPGRVIGYSQAFQQGYYIPVGFDHPGTQIGPVKAMLGLTAPD